MRRMELDEVKRLSLDMLCYFDKICKENGIHYSLAYGTLIGAARHKGFIPWDDDIDVMMLQPDYEKFINLPIFKGSQAGFRYQLHDRRKEKYFNEKYMFPFAKLEDASTVVEQVHSKEHGGIWIDIFPIYGAPSATAQYDSFMEKIQKNKNRLHAATKKSNEKVSVISAVKSLRRLFYRCSYRIWRDRVIELGQTYSVKDSVKVVNTVWNPYYKKGPFNKSWFDNYIEIEFEGFKFSCILEYDEFLIHVYGDWRKLPPEEKRVPQHEFVAYML